MGADQPPPPWVGEEREQPWGSLDRFDRASLAVDCVLLSVDQQELNLLVWRRLDPPEQGSWALPGVFVKWREDVDIAIRRVLKEKAGLDDLPKMEQISAVSYPDRDERGWVVSFIYCGLVPIATLRQAVADRPETVRLVSLAVPAGGVVLSEEISVDLPHGLALGHREVLRPAIEWLRREAQISDRVLDMLPDLFTLREYQEATEVVLAEPRNKDSFRRSVTVSHRWVEPTGAHRAVSGRQVAELYRRSGLD